MRIDDIPEFLRVKAEEGHHLDWKRDLPDRGVQGAKEFLADVVSFANSDGGLLVFGVEEERDAQGGTARPGKVVGVGDCNVDEVILALEQQMLHGIAPRLPGVRVRPVDLEEGVRVIAIEIAASWVGPHMVTLGGSSRFYGRGARGKFQMNVDQIRLAFSEAESHVERVRALLADRLIEMRSDHPEPLIAMHLVPLIALRRRELLAVPDLEGAKMIPPFHGSGWSAPKYDVRGVRSVATGLGNYTHFGLDGLLEGRATLRVANGQLNAHYLERGVVKWMRDHVAVLDSLGLPRPYLVSLALIGVRGAFIPSGHVHDYDPPEPIREDSVVLPSSTVVDANVDPASALRGTLDALWRLGGHRESPNFDESGAWIDPR